MQGLCGEDNAYVNYKKRGYQTFYLPNKLPKPADLPSVAFKDRKGSMPARVDSENESSSGDEDTFRPKPLSKFKENLNSLKAFKD